MSNTKRPPNMPPPTQLPLPEEEPAAIQAPSAATQVSPLAIALLELFKQYGSRRDELAHQAPEAGRDFAVQGALAPLQQHPQFNQLQQDVGQDERYRAMIMQQLREQGGADENFADVATLTNAMKRYQ